MKRLEWFGHSWRSDGQVIKNVLVDKTNKTRPLERPKTRWIDIVTNDLIVIDESASLQTAH